MFAFDDFDQHQTALLLRSTHRRAKRLETNKPTPPGIPGRFTPRLVGLLFDGSRSSQGARARPWCCHRCWCCGSRIITSSASSTYRPQPSLCDRATPQPPVGTGTSIIRLCLSLCHNSLKLSRHTTGNRVLHGEHAAAL